MAALVAGLLAQASDRTPLLVSGLATHTRRPGSVLAAAVLAVALSSAVGAAGGALVAPMLTPEARALLLGLALLSAGVPALLLMKAPRSLDRARLGAFGTALLLLTAATMGDGAQFLTAALAARQGQPVFAGVGVVIGSGTVLVAAALASPRDIDRLPLRAIRAVIGIGMIGTGLVAILGGLRLL